MQIEGKISCADLYVNISQVRNEPDVAKFPDWLLNVSVHLTGKQVRIEADFEWKCIGQLFSQSDH